MIIQQHLTVLIGCDSIATLHLVVNPVVTGEETITICEAALPYTWNGQNITAAGDYTATLTSVAVAIPSQHYIY